MPIVEISPDLKKSLHVSLSDGIGLERLNAMIFAPLDIRY
jgi:hypothetical protein